MVSKSEHTQSGKKTFLPRGGPYPQKHFHKHIAMSPANNGHCNTYNNKDINFMFNTSQIPDNPGYMDFSNPTPPVPANNKPQPNVNLTQNIPATKQNNNRSNFSNKTGPVQTQKNQNWNQNQRKNRTPIHNGPLMAVGSLPPPPPPLQHPPYGPPLRFSGMRRGQFNPLMNVSRRPILPPHNIIGPRGPMHSHIPPVTGAFKSNRPPIPSRRPPMHPGPNIPPFIRMGGNGAVSAPIRPLPSPQRGQRNRANGIGQMNTKINQRANSKPNFQKLSPLSRKNFKGPNKYTMKTLSEIGTQYHMDKPFVTDEIRAEYAKKVDIENRLKGKKDDKLFAEFKNQRDKFVALYNDAREKHASGTTNANKASGAKIGNTKKTG